MKVSITSSDRPEKRYKAVFTDADGGKKTVHFGYKTGSTYIDHKDNKIKDAWIARHKVRGNFNDYKSASSLAYHILWRYKSFNEAVRSYKNKFNLS
jgi:hypothetical protein